MHDIVSRIRTQFDHYHNMTMIKLSPDAGHNVVRSVWLIHWNCSFLLVNNCWIWICNLKILEMKMYLCWKQMQITWGWYTLMRSDWSIQANSGFLLVRSHDEDGFVLEGKGGEINWADTSMLAGVQPEKRTASLKGSARCWNCKQNIGSW